MLQCSNRTHFSARWVCYHRDSEPPCRHPSIPRLLMRLQYLRPFAFCVLCLPFLSAPAFGQRDTSSSSNKHLRSTLKIPPEVVECVSALNRAVRTDKAYDRVVQLDRYVIHAQVRRGRSIFGIGKPVPVDTVVSIKGSARVRGRWKWQAVDTQCGLRAGRVVATSIEPHVAHPRPTAKRRPRNISSYVENSPSSAPSGDALAG